MAGPRTGDATTHNNNDAILRRTKATVEPQWQRFQSAMMAPSHQVAAINNSQDKKSGEVHPYQRQYSHVYHQRHMQLAPFCRQAFLERQQAQAVNSNNNNNNIQQVDRLLELEEDIASFVVGVLVKEPCANTKDVGEPLVPGTQCRSTDVLYLEDESGRVTLQFVPPREKKTLDDNKDEQNHNDADLKLELQQIHQYCTGMVVGVQGQVIRGGSFLVQAVIPPKIKPAPSRALRNDEPSPYLLLVSGLECGSTTHSSLTRDMLLTFLEGRLPHPAAAHIARVVLCGGLVANNASPNDDKDELQPRRASPADGLRDLDAFCFQVTAGAGIPVDLLPGADDPTTANWPQRPLHSSLLLQSSNFGLAHCTPNPYAARMEGVQILATDGLNARNLTEHVLEVSNDNEQTMSRLTELGALRKQLEFGHVCPTGPTSVPTAPHAMKDPMALQEMPHVYVAGNCAKFATDTLSESRVICVPSFSVTGEAVLLNLHTLQVELLRFEDE